MYVAGPAAGGCQSKSRSYPALCSSVAPTTAVSPAGSSSSTVSNAGSTSSTSSQCYYRNRLSASQKAAILDKHNELRNKVASGSEARQPAATNMLELQWDDNLESIAQGWANTCPDKHNPARSNTGENLYWGMNSADQTNFDYSPGVQNWYDEVKYFSSSGINSYRFEAKTGHYTQVVWATTNKIGRHFYSSFPNKLFVRS
jgi:hypothetical protein